MIHLFQSRQVFFTLSPSIQWPFLTEEDRLSYRIAFSVVVVGLLAVPFTPVRLFAALVILCYLPAAPFCRPNRRFFPFLGRDRG